MKSPLLNLARFTSLLMLCAALGGCVSEAERQANNATANYFMGNFSAAQVQLAPLADKTDENFVLNNCRLGSAALANHDLAQAEAAFVKAYEVINSVGVNNGGRSLGAALVDEKIKIWKGEPFERAMVNYYLGMIYYMHQDYDNARAAFQNALFKLRDYTDAPTAGSPDDYKQVESNFAIGYVMLAKCYQRLGKEDLARANFQRAGELQRSLRPLTNYNVNAESNVLLVVDFGNGPMRVKNGDGAFVGFGPPPQYAGPLPLAEVTADGHPLTLDGANRPPIDLLALAQDRRWQSIDTIRAVKDVVGTGLIAAGAYEGLKRHPDSTAALALIGAGVLLKATSQADTRTWEMLPRTSYVIPLRLPPGKHDITVRFPGYPGVWQTWRGFDAPESGEATYYLRILPYENGPYDWPGGAK